MTVAVSVSEHLHERWQQSARKHGSAEVTELLEQWQGREEREGVARNRGTPVACDILGFSRAGVIVDSCPPLAKAAIRPAIPSANQDLPCSQAERKSSRGRTGPNAFASSLAPTSRQSL